MVALIERRANDLRREATVNLKRLDEYHTPNPDTYMDDVWDTEEGGDAMREMEPAKEIERKRIMDQLTGDIRYLIERGVQEMKAYDVHAKASRRSYEETLEGLKGTSVAATKATKGFNHFDVASPTYVASPLSTISPGSAQGGIGKANSHEQSPIDPEAVRRLSTGMPVVGGVPPSSTTRTYEKLEDLLRRGSNSR
jgi:hypothetical protein